MVPDLSSPLLIALALNAALVYLMSPMLYGPSLGNLEIAGFPKGGMKRRQRMLWICMGILALIAACSLGYHLRNEAENYYKVLDVPRQSQMLDIRQAYKRASKQHHPDKNPLPDANERFQKLTTAYTVLMDDTQRSSYNKFGEAGVAFDPRNDEIKLFSSVLVKYVVWIIFMMCLTMRTAVQSARVWISVCCLVLLLTEGFLLVTESPFPAWVPSHSVTEFEFLTMAHITFPSIMGLFCVMAECYYVDVDTITLLTMREMAKSYRTMKLTVQKLSQLQDNSTNYEVDDRQSLVSPLEPFQSQSDCISADDDAVKEPQQQPRGTKLAHRQAQQQAAASELDILRDHLDMSLALSDGLVDSLSKSSPGLGSNYYWIVFVIMFGAMLLIS